MSIGRSLKGVVRILNGLKSQKMINGYALIGGLSVSVWGLPRSTKDIDFLVSLVSMDNLCIFSETLKRKGLKPELHKGDYSDPVPYVIKSFYKGVPLDMLITTKKWEDEAVENTIMVDFERSKIPVIAPEYLIVMKLKAGGPRDILDAKELLEINDLDRELLEGLSKRLRVNKRLEKFGYLKAGKKRD